VIADIEGKRHGFSSQRLHIAVEQRLGDPRCLVPAPDSPARRVARLALDEVAFGSPLDLLLQEIIRRGRILFGQIYHRVFGHLSFVSFQTFASLESI
jgi:hypothetical protein